MVCWCSNMIIVEDILKETEKYDVVCFDVFDTLLIRDVMKPTDVFRFSYGELGRYIRIISEMSARKSSKTGEVTLEDIERRCLFSCKNEVNTEREVCRANPQIKIVYDVLKKQGKKMYALSDMYLTGNTISELLHNAGYDIPVIVSCEYGCDKTSGKLFQMYLSQYSLSSSKVVHIGDSKTSDFDGAEKAQIKCILIDKHSNHLSYTRYTKNNYELAAFVNHGLCEEQEPVEGIGYEIIGPIILAFCQWVHEKFEEQRYERLFFLARDMRFVYEVYRSLYPDDDVRYLCVSRKSLQFARNNPDAFCDYLKNEKCFGNVSIVDTGWIGNAQIEIEKFAKLIDPSSDIGGLYLGSKLAYRNKPRSKRSYVFLYSSWGEQFKCQIFPPFMETLIGCNEKQVIRYENGMPVFDRDKDRDFTNNLKNGAKQFIADWTSVKGNKRLDKSVRRPFERLFYNPKREHIDLIGSLRYEDFKDTKIVSFDENCHYWRHPGKLFSDMSYSGWKGAFMKKCGIWYPILLGFYFIFGTTRLYLIDKKKCKKAQL